MQVSEQQDLDTIKTEPSTVMPVNAGAPTDGQLLRYAFSMMLELDFRTNILHDYLIFEYAEENVLFWRKVFAFNEQAAHMEDTKTARKQLAQAALNIVDEFLKPNSPFSVNISGNAREKILDDIGKSKIKVGMFQTAVHEVENMMVQGPFPRLVDKITQNVAYAWELATQKMDAAEFGKVLFMNWFMVSREVMPLFSSDMKKHGSMLIAVIEGAVGVLTDLRELVPKLVALGQRHVNYGSEPEYFESLSFALQQTFKEVLCDQFTEDMRSGWETVLELMSSIMLTSMAREREKQYMVEMDEEAASPDGTLSKPGEMGLPFILEMEMQDAEMNGALEHYFRKGHLEVWRAVYVYKQSFMQTPRASNENLRQQVHDIFEKYLSPEAKEVPIQVSPHSYSVVKGFLSSKSEPDPTMLDCLWRDIDEMMANRPFPRFNEKIGHSILDSWDFVINKMGKNMFGKVLFMNFFELVPDVATMFTDVSKHGLMFAEISGMAIHSLGDLKTLIPLLMNTGKRHVAYNVREDQFSRMGQALVNTMRGTMKDQFTKEMEKAWLLVFSFLSKVMIRSIHIAREAGDTSSVGGASEDSATYTFLSRTTKTSKVTSKSGQNGSQFNIFRKRRRKNKKLSSYGSHNRPNSVTDTLSTTSGSSETRGMCVTM